MLSYFQAALLGVLQGITELFPVSSLGHSILLPALLGWTINQNANYFLTFLVATHFATAAVLFFLYWSDWRRIISGILRSIAQRTVSGDADGKLGWLLIVGTVPAGLVGIIFQKKVQGFFTSPSYVAAFLVLNGVLLYTAELLGRKAKKNVGEGDTDERIAKEISWRQSMGVGIMQILALLPGFSRTGSTIAGGLLVGMAHEDALRFSFLLATPIIAAAAAIKLPMLFASRDVREIETALVGALCAAIGSYLSVIFLTRYFKTRTLNPFAIYCLAFGILSLIFLRS
jgi:undecaprenyl-diphosphatase